MRAARTLLGAATVALPCLACSGERCLANDYTPPGAEVAVRLADTGEALCERTRVTTDREEEAVLYPDVCRYVISSWYPTADAAPSVSLHVDGYEDVTVVFEIERNVCGEIQRPAPREVEFTPAQPEPEPPTPSGDSGVPVGDAGSSD